MDYYIHKNDQNIGPLPESKVIEGLKNKEYLPSDLGCRIGQSEWRDLSILFPVEIPTQSDTSGKINLHSQLADQQNALAMIQNRSSHIQTTDIMKDQSNIIQASAGSRWLALMIDMLVWIPLILIGSIVIAVIPLIGSMLASLVFAAFWAFRDLKDGSIGKKLLGLKVVSLNGQPPTMNQLVTRNLPFAAPQLLHFVPYIGTIIAVVIMIPLILVEDILVLAGKPRIGDRMAKTMVVKT